MNLTGTFICSQEFALHFKREAGNIINISASTGIRGRKNGCNYCASKAGVINLTKCLALELAPKIRVNCIVPGYIETEEVMTRYKLDRKGELCGRRCDNTDGPHGYGPKTYSAWRSILSGIPATSQDRTFS